MIHLREAVAFGVFLATMPTVGLLTYAGWQHVRRIGKAAERPNEAINRIDERLTRIEHAVDAIALEVERGSEAQRFAARLLADRYTSVPPIVARDVPPRILTPH